MNIVFIPNINLGDNRSTPYHYSIKSWKQWAQQYDDIEVIEWTEPIMDPKEFKITLQRYWVHDILQYNNIEYDQVLIVDADTIVHLDCPNFFNETKGEFGVVLNNGCYEWVTRSISEWGRCMFPDQPKVKTWEYFNGGFQITSKKHIPFYNKVKDYYTTNINQINQLGEQIKAGTDQTIINYLTNKLDIKKTYLPECYNLQDLFKKSLLHIPGYSGFPDELKFLEAGYIYHFNGIPTTPHNRNTAYWMERTYKHLYND